MDNQINSLLPGNYPSISTSPEFMQSPSLSSGQAPRCAQCPLRTEQDRLVEGSVIGPCFSTILPFSIFLIAFSSYSLHAMSYIGLYCYVYNTDKQVSGKNARLLPLFGQNCALSIDYSAVNHAR